MTLTNAHLALATLLVAGCAAGPRVADQAPQAPRSATAPVAPNAPLAPVSAAAAQPAQNPSPPAPAPAPEALAAVIPDAVIDVRENNASTSPPIICRDILKPNSNVHVRQCMTESDWEVFKRAEARRAEELTRMFQGGIFRRY